MIKVTKALLVTATKVASVFLSTVYILMLTKLFDIKIVGEYFVVSSIILVLSVIFKFGYESLIIKKFDRFKHNFDNVLDLHTKQTMPVYIITCVFFLYFGDDFLHFINVESLSKMKLIIMVTCAYLYSKSIIKITLIQLKEDFFIYGVLSTLTIPAFSIVFTYITGDAFNSLIITYFLLYVLSSIYVYTHKSISFNEKCKDINKGQLSICIIQYVALISQYFIVFFVSAMSSSEDVAGFSLGQRLSGLLLMLLMGVNVISSPQYSKYFRESNWNGIKLLYNKMQKFILLIIIPAVLLFLIFSNDIISLFSEDLMKYNLLITILFIGQAVNVCTGSVGTILVMVDAERFYKRYLILCNILLLLLSYPVSVYFGILGLAVAVSLSIAMINILSYIKVLGILKSKIELPGS